MTALTDAERRARDAAALDVIADALASAQLGLPTSILACRVLSSLRAHGLFDHTCDDLCGTEPDDHHVCGEDGHECDDECVCHGYSNDEDDDGGVAEDVSTVPDGSAAPERPGGLA